MDNFKNKIQDNAKKAIQLQKKINELKQEMKKIKMDYNQHMENCRSTMESQNFETFPIDEQNKLVFKNKIKNKSFSKDFIKEKIHEFCLSKIKGVDADQLSQMITDFLLNEKKKNNTYVKIIYIKNVAAPGSIVNKRMMIEKDEITLSKKPKLKIETSSSINQENLVLNVLRQ